MKPLHAGLYGLAVTGALLDDGVAMVLTQDEQSSTEQQWTEDQQAEQTQQQTM